MSRHKSIFQAAAILFISACIAIGPLTTSASAYSSSFGAALQGPIEFTPSVEELELTTVAATAMATAVADPAAFADPNPPVDPVSGETILIGGKEYPLGDTFTDAEDIPRGVVQDSLFHDQGYSTILAVGGDKYRLIWVTDRGEKQYMIVREDDELFSGPDGFKETIEALGESEERTFDAAKVELGGLGAILLAEFALCPATVGTSCIAAIVTGIGGLVGGFLLGMWRIFTDYAPARNNVGEAYEQIEINRP
jgi:hypothetical protein